MDTTQVLLGAAVIIAAALSAWQLIRVLRRRTASARYESHCASCAFELVIPQATDADIRWARRLMKEHAETGHAVSDYVEKLPGQSPAHVSPQATHPAGTAERVCA